MFNVLLSGIGCSILHLRHPLVAFLRAQPPSHVLRRVRITHRRMGVSNSDMAGIRQFHGQPHLLHHLQQGVPASVQKSAALSVPQQHLETAQVTGAED